AGAWGRQAHEMINAAAIKALPEPLRSYFRPHQFYLVEHASDPDTLAGRDRAEERHHFADVDAYDPYPFRAFQRQFVAADRPPTPVEIENGDAMWQIERFTARLASDFRARRWDDADRDAIFSAHYAADLTQPLHTVVNFDGQRTGQNGIHQRFETGVVRFYADRWKLQVRPAASVPNLRERIFAEFIHSYQASSPIFAADKKVRSRWGYGDPHFLPAFAQRAGPLAQAQIEDAASFVGSLWYTAWVRAGKPDLSLWKTGARAGDF
ncbi:MAG: hypothetical protein ACRD2P_05095, partial [Terriglobia bacterium]